MSKQHEQLEALRQIRSMMEKSSRFLSLSGLSGIIAGVTALAGVIAAYWFLELSLLDPGYYQLAVTAEGELNGSFYLFFSITFSLVLTVALLGAAGMAVRRAKQEGRPVWDAVAKRLLINLLIPLFTGGLFCLILIYHELLAFVAPATLIFYGLALVNASKYTLDDIRSLGIVQIAIGLLATVYPDYGLLFWAFGFGLLHIVYGVAMYNKYEK